MTKTTPERKPRPKDKFEISPTSRAKCRTCRRKISAGQGRYGISAFSPRCNDYIFQYYHKKCLPSSIKPSMEASPDKQVAQQRQTETLHQRLLMERAVLRESLRQLRASFSKRLDRSPFIIFNEKTLDDIVVKLPQSKTELLQVVGFKEKRYRNFGSAILTVTRQYLQDQPQKQVSREVPAATMLKSRRLKRVPVISLVDDEDEEELSPIEVARSLTCEEIVASKFKEAKKKGYVISVD